MHHAQKQFGFKKLASLLLLSLPVTTVDMEIFIVKIFSWFAQTTKIKNTKYILQWIINAARTFLFAQFHSTTSQLAISRKTVSSILACHSSSWQTRENFSLSVRQIVCLYCHSTCLQRNWVPFCVLVVHQQLHVSHKHSMQAVCTLSVRSFVPDH